MAEAAVVNPSECWCCGVIDDRARMVQLGNHPEVSLCLPCARWASQQAWAIEDRGRSGPMVLVRDRLREARLGVVHRGWHQLPVLGRPLRWLGKRLP